MRLFIQPIIPTVCFLCIKTDLAVSILVSLYSVAEGENKHKTIQICRYWYMLKEEIKW